ncbi:hypothetical protein JVT61DRAFT_947 [Boletus reticuloceps]|uniref:Uncharacterized protein n=1 Tax=Boletus reticuloceps TaxID=495285 RepID=A0A8I2YRN6_9AGAM|nr:hypothetical protein JVT61DRAFT_947 [Boletus reticuloceps]
MSTTLNCLGWMQNQNDQNPCTVAQDVGQLCNTEYTVSLTNFQEGKYVPNATTTSGCTCSWSIYNLLSACAYCVGQSQYPSWNTWVADCGSNASSISRLGLRTSQGIPFWAATNPSIWDNATFNVVQAADIAAAAHPDVTGGPLPTSTSTTTSSSAPSISVGPIVGGVIGAITLLVIGALTTCWAVRRHRRQGTHTTPIGVPSFNASQPIIVPVPSIRHQAGVQPFPYGYTYRPVSPLASPAHSTTRLTATSPLASPVSSGFSSQGNSASLPVTDAADIITPFLARSSTRHRNRSNAPRPTSKAAEVRSERATSPSGRRLRLNPPPYSAFVAPESSGTTMPGAQNVSTKKHKRRNGSGSDALGAFKDVDNGECDHCPYRFANGAESDARCNVGQGNSGERGERSE